MMTTAKRHADFAERLGSPKACVEFCQEVGLMAESRHCLACGTAMSLSERRQSSDGLSWRCCKKGCCKERSIREGSWFAKSNLSIRQIVDFTYWWVRKVPQHDARLESAIRSRVTSVDWASFCREVCSQILCHLLETERLGGVGTVVEIAESKFGRGKYHRGRMVEGCWVFGGVDRTSKHCFLEVVTDRTSSTLLAVLQRYVLPSTTIVSDCWKAYHCLEDEGFPHLTVDHSQNFVDPHTGAHTNTIENLWMLAKSSIPRSSLRHVYLQSYLDEFRWRRRYSGDGDLLDRFLSHVCEVYPPVGESSGSRSSLAYCLFAFTWPTEVDNENWGVYLGSSLDFHL